ASYLSLGVLYEYTGRYDQAESHCRRALEIQRNVLPDDDLRIASTSLVLAMAVAWGINTPPPPGRLKEEEPLLTEAAALRRAKLRRAHLDVCVAKIALAAALLTTDPARSAELLHEVGNVMEGDLSRIVSDYLLAEAVTRLGDAERGVALKRLLVPRMKAAIGET